MRVVLLSHEYPPYIYGGVGTFVRSLANGLCKNGAEVTIITGYPVPSRDVKRKGINTEKNAESTVIRVPYLSMPPRATIFQLLNVKKIREIVKNIDADIVHGQSGSTFPAILNLRNLVPVVVTFHSSPKVEKNLSAYSLARGGSLGDFWTWVIGYPAWFFTFRGELSNSDSAVAVSKTLRSELLDEMGKSYLKKVHTIHNGVDLEALDNESEGANDDGEESENTILFAGRLYWGKGALNLIKMAHILRRHKLGFKIVVYGVGPLFGRMQKEIQTLGLNNIELRGFIGRAQLMKNIRRSKYVVIPSYHEACPMILLESMCLGRIPVMFDLPYAREFTGNGKYGILAKSVEDMALKMKMVHENDDTKQLESEIRSYARNKYDITGTAREYCDLYGEVQSKL